MSAWRYKALDRAGSPLTGTMEAPDEAAVVRRLRRDGAVPVSILEAKGGGFWNLPFATGRDSLSQTEVAYITRELATMLAAGQDLDRALRFLVETARTKRSARVLTVLRDDVRDGTALAAAMAKLPDSFSRLYVGLVRAGEAGATLAPALERLADLLDNERRLAATVRSALIYPILLLVAAIGAVALLLTQVLPQFAPLFEQSGAALPASTRLLIDAGDAVSRHWFNALLVLLVLAVLTHAALRLPAPRLAFDRLKLRLPLIGGLPREVMAARLARTLGSLLFNGVSLVTALAITREVLGNDAGIAAVDHATASVKNGAGLAVPLSESGLFPPHLIHLLRLGEETARLGPMALHAAGIHEERVRVTTQRLVSLLTPAITIGMGAVIAGIVSSLLLAMLSLNDLAQ